jgi:hypothetical protein
LTGYKYFAVNQAKNTFYEVFKLFVFFFYFFNIGTVGKECCATVRINRVIAQDRSNICPAETYGMTDKT